MALQISLWMLSCWRLERRAGVQLEGQVDGIQNFSHIITDFLLQNGGHCQPIFFEYPHDPEIGHFELSNYNTLKSLIETSSIDCEWTAQPGVRGIYSASKLAQARDNITIVQRTNPELGNLMTLVTDKPTLTKYHHPHALGAVITSLAARLWPYKLVAHILSTLLTAPSKPLNLQTLTPALSISSDPSSPHSHTVHTPRGQIKTKTIALATNAYTSHLLPAFSDLIVPVRGQMSALAPPPSLSGPSARLHTSMGFEGDGLDDYLIQRPEARGGHLMFGGGRNLGESMGVTDDGVVEAKTARYLRRTLLDACALPEGRDASAELAAVAEWTGIMGFSRDEVPWVGPVPGDGARGVFVAAGFTGHGMPNTWLSGKAVASMVRAGLRGENGVEVARRETGLPGAYLVTEERVERALKGESVEIRDEKEKGRGERVVHVADGE